MNLSCRKCKKEFEFYKLERVDMVFSGDEITLKLDTLCEGCGNYTNKSVDYSPDEIVTRAKCLNILTAKIIDEHGREIIG